MGTINCFIITVVVVVAVAVAAAAAAIDITVCCNSTLLKLRSGIYWGACCNQRLLVW